MGIPETLRGQTFIIICLMCFFIGFFSPFISYAQDEEKRVEVSTFDEFTSSLNQIQSTGGTIVLTQDITVPAEGSYTYNNGMYRKEVVIETNGHTISVEGYLELWPFLTICGDGGQKQLFHVYPGGELRLVSICLDAGENGIAVIQEEGSFFLCGSEESSELPSFSCIGQIISSKTITAAAYWRYHCEKLPIVRIPAGADFTADMLPDQVLSLVNCDHQEYEEEVSVVWDETTFPTEHERTLVRGKFVDGYSQFENYVPQCLVVWESDTSPFFLNVYLESITQWNDMVFMYGQSPQPGTIYIQSSDDGENWTEISVTDDYAPVEVEKDASFSWTLFYDQSDPAQKRPRYYRLLQILDDGTKLYSDALELNDDLIFTVADIEGGRGGETTPNEGEDQLTNGMPDMPETETVDETLSSKLPDSSIEMQPDIEPDDSQQPKNEIGESESHGDAENTEESSNFNDPMDPAGTSLPNDIITGAEPEENEEIEQEAALAKANGEQSGSVETDGKILCSTDAQRIVGIAIVVCILAGSIVFFVFKRKK